MCKRCETRPPCLMCGERPARVLPVQAFEDLKGPVFCTMFCAARFAFLVGYHHSYRWCVECCDWHNHAAGCAETGPARFTTTGVNR